MNNSTGSIRPLALTPGVPTQVADHLTELIVRGELAPGERIPEARITASLGVSRGSVRAAMQILERRHLVELRPRRGAVVTPLTASGTAKLYAVMISNYATLGRAAAIAWESQDDLEPLRLLMRRLENNARPNDVLGLIDFSRQLTEAACSLADNEYLSRIFIDLWPVFSRSYYRALVSNDIEIVRTKKLLATLIDAVEQRDADTAERLLRELGEHQQALVMDIF